MEQYLDKTLSFEERAKDLVSRMTLDEKASQLTYHSAAVERLGIPAYNWWNEALHGVARAGTATVFPQAISSGIPVGGAARKPMERIPISPAGWAWNLSRAFREMIPST